MHDGASADSLDKCGGHPQRRGVAVVAAQFELLGACPEDQILLMRLAALCQELWIGHYDTAGRPEIELGRAAVRH